MGLMDKFKNLFTDEEIIEEENVEPIEIKEVKKEEINQLPTFMREKIEQEKNDLKTNDSFSSPIISEKKIENDKKEELEEPKNSFKFPLEFNDDDFIETRSRQKTRNHELDIRDEFPKKDVVKNSPLKSEPKVKVKDIYKDKKEIAKEEVKRFKATPIISPIYGILDKNYSPTDVECNVGENFEKDRHSKNVDFDSVRKKAYGNLSKEIKENLMCENCEYLKEAKECRDRKTSNREVEENMVYEAMNEPNNEPSRDIDYSNITMEDALENYYDYGVEYNKDNNYINLADDNDQIIVNNSEINNRPKKEIPPVKSSINLLSTLKKSAGDEKKNLELTDDLFNLIDSMYDERNDS